MDVHLGDMVIPLAVLAGGRSRFSVPEYTGHMESAIHISRIFDPSIDVSVEHVGKYYLVSLSR